MTDLCGMWSEEVKVDDGMTYPLSITYRLKISLDNTYTFDADFICGSDPLLYSFRVSREGSWTIADSLFTLIDSCVTADQISIGVSFPIASKEAMRQSILADWPIQEVTYEIVKLNETEFKIRKHKGDQAEHKFIRA